MQPNDSQRLDRIEQKLDKMADAIVSLARMEERMITLFRRMDNYETTQAKVDERVNKLEKISTTRGVVISGLERLFWIGVTIGLTVFFTSKGG